MITQPLQYERLTDSPPSYESLYTPIEKEDEDEYEQLNNCWCGCALDWCFN